MCHSERGPVDRGAPARVAAGGTPLHHTVVRPATVSGCEEDGVWRLTAEATK